MSRDDLALKFATVELERARIQRFDCTLVGTWCIGLNWQIMSGLKYGLNVPKKSQASAPKKALFDDEDEEILKPPTGNSKSKKPISQFGNVSSQSKNKKSTTKVEELDPSIYDYEIGRAHV